MGSMRNLDEWTFEQLLVLSTMNKAAINIHRQVFVCM